MTVRINKPAINLREALSDLEREEGLRGLQILAADTAEEAIEALDLENHTFDINGGTIDGTVIGGSTPAAGTFTTLTSDDGEVYAPGNILGTVSESSGVPTGAIIERGSNANGEFVKYADGTLICSGSMSFDWSSVVLQLLPNSATFSNFPSGFFSFSNVTTITDDWLKDIFSRMSSSQVYLQQVTSGRTGTTTVYYHLLGRWF